MDDEELEQFCRTWVERKAGYVEVKRYGGAGDKGRDVVGFLTAKRHEDAWDNYQCKQYRRGLDVDRGLLAVGKVLYWASREDFTAPRRFFFVAPKGLAGKLHGLVDKPSEFKNTLITGWDAVCAKRIVQGKIVTLDTALMSVIDSFPFESIYTITVDDNFAQLKLVYASDVARLESLEEAGFLLAIDSDRPCPVCGAAPEAQKHDHGLGEIEKVRIAAEVEIAKIKTHQSELDSTIADAEAELSLTTIRLQSNQNALESLEEKIKAASPDVEEQQQKFADIIPKRDRINYGLDLFSRREDLESQRVKISKSKQVRRETNFQAGLSMQVAQEFADEVASILTIWDFPGERRVVFDPETQDLIIDAKHRKHNGKGVRAITHAAFKVALLTYCNKRNLAHPGFLILDTPLITYRDPMRSAAGVLTPDEEELLRTDLKERFFQHLGSLTGSQIILLDNTDPPPNALSFASIETFTNNAEEGRQGTLRSYRFYR